MRIFKNIYNLNLRQKIIFSYYLLSIIPLIALNLFSYHKVKDILINNEKTNLIKSLNQSIVQINGNVQVYNNLSDYFFTNEHIITTLNQDYTDEYYKMYLTYTNDLEPVINSYLSLHSDISQIQIYTDSGLLKYKKFIGPLTDIVGNKWYNRVISNYNSNWFSDGMDTLFLARNLLFKGESPKTNILYIKLNYNKFFEPLQNIANKNYGVAVLDENKKLVFSYDSLKNKNSRFIIKNHEIEDKNTKLIDEYSDNYVILSAPLNKDWSIYLYKPLPLISGAANQIAFTIIIIMVLCFILLNLLIYFITNAIVSPIEALTKNIRNVENGIFTVSVKSNKKDEIGILIRSFDKMIHQIEYLIKEVYTSKIKQKDYELKALHAQINPHFLYNSLSLINSRAITSGNEDISQMTLLLSQFYRTSLNHGKDITTIGNEVINTKSYISIQMIMWNNKFTVTYDIEETVLNYEMPNLILQPIVENAISHGLKNSEKEDKVLEISIIGADDKIVFKIKDNGVGIPQEDISNILDKHTNGYGLNNVNERIRLIYGESYGVNILSEVGVYTCAEICIPRQA
ncbi:sensor histidine kinase [Anaerocolumna sp. MB42-C2]|uniref:sensor histidine kinase n=1 Tax=Anaerocolumna sp. MB42-C2 TaxID=3070997 RepID=UPI0027DF401C|nr:sensor histidine kinase [Anaerocolumna sp. MB42-C2]WMJ86479.1 sensor histidine kinase [Anaerocolumna sp. MB42-C2]